MPTLVSRPRKIRKSKNSYAPLLAVDAEWDPQLPAKGISPDKWISTVIAMEPDKTICYLTDVIPLRTRKRLNTKARELGVEVRYIQRDDDTRLVPDGRLRLTHFFSAGLGV